MADARSDNGKATSSLEKNSMSKSELRMKKINGFSKKELMIDENLNFENLLKDENNQTIIRRSIRQR